MKFLIDAQLPRRMADLLAHAGHDVLHTLDLPSGNRTPDDEIAVRAQLEERIVVTKDDDFVRAYLVFGRPPRLLLIATGNIANSELLSLLNAHLPGIETAFLTHRFLELTREVLVIHE